MSTSLAFSVSFWRPFFLILGCAFPVEPQSPNGKNINLHKRWGFRRFQKEQQKVRKTALFMQKVCKKVHKKCGVAHFLLLFLELAETSLFVQINVFAVRALRLDRKYTNIGSLFHNHLSLPLLFADPAPFASPP